MVSNTEFARRVGCHFTLASRYRNGKRLPGTDIFERIVVAFDLDRDEALERWRAGAKTFASYLRKQVFEAA